MASTSANVPRDDQVDLLDLERRRELERGDVRAEPKVPLQVHVKHNNDTQMWRVDRDMTLEPPDRSFSNGAGDARG